MSGFLTHLKSAICHPGWREDLHGLKAENRSASDQLLTAAFQSLDQIFTLMIFHTVSGGFRPV